jgi:hypothetical protein
MSNAPTTEGKAAMTTDWDETLNTLDALVCDLDTERTLDALAHDLTSQRTVYLQATTGKLHLSDSCGITRRTRYNHFPVEYAGDYLKNPHCGSCWDGKAWDVKA